MIGLIAGGDKAIRQAVEFAEDNQELSWNDLLEFNINSNDSIVGIAASGSTTYVSSALERCQKENISTGCIVSNKNSDISNFFRLSNRNNCWARICNWQY